MRCADRGVPGASQRVPSLLIGCNEDEVWTLGQRSAFRMGWRGAREFTASALRGSPVVFLIQDDRLFCV